MAITYPAPVPEFPVNDMEESLKYYKDKLGFNIDWVALEFGLAGVSKDHARIFLAHSNFREKLGNNLIKKRARQS